MPVNNLTETDAAYGNLIGKKRRGKYGSLAAKLTATNVIEIVQTLKEVFRLRRFLNDSVSKIASTSSISTEIS